jgi:hypothetical protein
MDKIIFWVMICSIPTVLLMLGIIITRILLQ